ncbi:BTAD domain-containing putative transcriptional regulator [Streptomyces sp. NBC_00233]|uniref:BTAD domain-containing putative transcriptional regulator n=1 Tax=Streptomyces sp. NBC_00233 TaxID=2975686 RepID=UPI002251AE71|nr:BTAD domain-containing putative transcriptional regulator [Streptomyces sp. NBC_00233]MCX5226044.1 winged helix-turn-helix domain-containing protein [Streptomyces sp. NBC_00233]
MRFAVLGETAVRTEDGTPVRVPELKVRALLAALLVDAGRPVAAFRLVDDLWGDEPPGNPLRALQAKVSQLRRAFEEAEPGGRDLVVTQAPGYLLAVPEGALDAHEFARIAARARETADPHDRAVLLGEALDLWRGPAFAEFAEEPFARAAADRLEEERLVVRETQAEARLESGEQDVLAGELAELVARHPLRERLRAVQLRALYRAGRQSEALAGYEELRTLLADELGLDPSPELTALHAAMLRQDASLSAPAAAPPAPVRATPRPAASGGPVRGNLFTPLTGIVGRDAAVAEVRGLLAERRLVTLTGPGGVGKTRLAVEAAGQAREEFADGVWLVEFAGARGELAEVVAAALELRDDGVWGLRPEGERALTTAERLAEVLRGRRTLLVLDNCEHVVDEAASLAELLLRTAPGLVVLTTSQEPLALAGETLWAVEPLDGDGAVELFTARAAASAPGFGSGAALDPAGLEAVRAICRRLDGIPLALELAATRVRALGVHGLLARLDDRFRLLDAGLRGAPARQQTLRAVIDWSWELLGEQERTVLRRLAVHAEGCTLGAAEEVCAGGAAAGGAESGAGEEVSAGDVLGLLARLVDRSLVVAVDGPDGPRYRLLESVAAYCLERLEGAGETEAVRDRHLTHYLRLAEDAEPALRGPGQRRRLAHLDAETSNLRAALDRALAAPGTARNAEAALRLVDALAWYWIMRGRLGEALRSATAALRAVLPETPRNPENPENPESQGSQGSQGSQENPARPEQAALRARVEVWRTGLAIMGGDGTDRRQRITKALAAYDGTAPLRPSDHAWARWFLAHALCGTGSQSEGGRLTGQALDGARVHGDRWVEAAALADRSVQRLLGGDVAGAEEDAARSDALFAEVGDACCRLWSVYPLATVAEIHGEYERADRLKRAGLAAAEGHGLTTEVPDLLAGIGRTALLRGDLAEARAYHAAARDRAVEVGFRAGEINAVLGLGLGARREGLIDEAEAHMREVLDWHRAVGLDSANALILAELGFSALARGDAAGALRLQEEGYGTALASGDPRAVALALEGLASAHAGAGRAKGAALLLGAASALRASTGAPLPPAERSDVDATETTARTTLGPEAYTKTFTHGTTLPHEQAVTEAGRPARAADPTLEPLTKT